MVSRQYQIDVARRLRCTLKRFAVSYLTLPAVNDAFTNGQLISAGLRAETNEEALLPTLGDRRSDMFSWR
jgi:hypothetical protein